MITSILLFLFVLAVFVAPGYGCVRYLLRGDRLSAPLRWTLAFTWSFALFALIAGPFLWCGSSFRALVPTTVLVWLAYGMIGGLAWWRAGKLSASGAPDAPVSSRLGLAWDEEGPPRLWTALAVGFVLLQAVSAVVYDRPDWDDCYYLAAMVDDQGGGVLNAEEPTHREGFPVPNVQRLLCWELWGAEVCHFTGLHPLVLFHTVLPGILVMLAYAAYAALFREYLPRRWVPLALLGLSAYHLWAISGHSTAANHFLPRLWQGKAILLHIAIPLLVFTLTRYAGIPSWRRWLSLLLVVVFGLGVSISAIFMEVVLCLCLLPGLLWMARGQRVRVLVGTLAALAPLVLCGLLVRSAAQGDPVLLGRPPSLATWTQVVNGYAPIRGAEVLWLLSLPILAMLLPDRRSAVYWIGFPIMLALTFANPFAYDLVARQLTSYFTYYRLLWLFPVGPGLGAMVAMTARFLATGWGVTTGRAAVTVPLGVAGLFVLAISAIPGLYVWSPRNSFIGPLGTPHLAQNAEKIPADLVPLVRRVQVDPDVSDVRVLCDEQVASFLTAYAPRLRFVQTRAMYTAYYLKEVGRPAEGQERCVLASVLQFGESDGGSLANLQAIFGEEGMANLFGGRSSTSDIGTLLLRYRVRYVIVAPGDQGADVWLRWGYRQVEHQGDFVLWQAAGRIAGSEKLHYTLADPAGADATLPTIRQGAGPARPDSR